MSGHRRAALKAYLPPRLYAVLDTLNVRLDEAKRTASVARAKRRAVGAGTLVENDVHVIGWASVEIGRNSIIGGGSVITVNLPRVDDPRIAIGDNVFLGQHCFLSSGTSIQIASFCLVGHGCRIISAGHLTDDPFRPMLAGGIEDYGSIAIGANVWLGVGATVLGDVTIGHGSVIGANALVTHDVPPFSVAIGSPARVIRRFDPVGKRWVDVADFTDAMAQALPDEANYLDRLRPHARTMRMPYRAAGHQRGDLA